MKRTKLHARGKSDTSVLKDEIQKLLRELVIKRDKGCILRGVRLCGGEVGGEGVVLQADHLITRSNSATYADSRLVVCVCRRCHGWKSLGGNMRKAQYDELVRHLLPKERVELWNKCELESWQPNRMGAPDWKMCIVLLKKEIAEQK